MHLKNLLKLEGIGQAKASVLWYGFENWRPDFPGESMYLPLFFLIMLPYLCIFGGIIPAITTGIAYGALTVWTDLFRKEISKEKVFIVLIIVFVFTAILSCGSFAYYFRDHTIMLD